MEIPVATTSGPEYRPRQPGFLRNLFRQRFPDFQALYEERYASFYGKFRLPLIAHAASAFRLCGDWRQGIARIRCPDCGFDFFRAFSCKSFFLCPSCAQKRTLLLGEYLRGNLLLNLPHRQFVWTLPKVLRPFLRNDRTLFSDIGRLIFDILSSYFSQAAGRPLQGAMLSSHQTFGTFAMWNPHWHTIVLEGGFDHRDQFFFIPIGANEALTEIWRNRVVALFLDKGLLNPQFARTLLSWAHSGFSIDGATRIYDEDARRSLSQYIVRAAFSQTMIAWDQEQDTVTWKAPQKGFFKGTERHFSCLDFIAQLTLHIPPRGMHLLRRFGLYSSRGRGTWKDRPALASRAPQNWYGRQAAQPPAAGEPTEDQGVSVSDSRKAWARLLAMIYDVDPFRCPKCGSTMSVIAIIRNPAEIQTIAACLAKHGRGPPDEG